MLCFIFISTIIRVNHFIFRCFGSSVLYTFPTLSPYGYDVILSKVFNLLSALLLSAILLISSVYTLCASFLNLFCDFNMISILSKQLLQPLNLSLRFITDFFPSGPF